MTNLTPVQQYYKDKTVFITGASGFMGKVLLEKLLYSCSDLKEIIIIVRPKRGKTPDSRLEDMFKLPIFQRIKEEKPEVLKKVTIYQGDVTYDTLGLSGDNLKHVLASTNIVFHMAATLKLEGNLKDAVDMNLTGTKRALAIAKQMKNLEAFVHLSTAFCNCDQEVMYEKVYEFPHKPEDLMRLAEWMDVKTLDAITPDLLKPHPNTYTYSKRLAELLVRDHYDTMPVIIARPSIVSPSAYEPVRGWVDNLNGPTGLMVGAGKGVIRSMLIDEHHKSEVIPVDYAINGLIVIPYNFSQEASRPAEVPVYNITCADHRKVPWGEVIRLSKKIGYQYPVEAGLWYPDGCITTNRLHHKINVLLFHWLPAYFIDFMLFLLGQKRFMIRVQNRVQIGLEVLQFFTMRAWEFKATSYLNLWPNLTPEDQLIFNMKMETDETIEEYMLSCIQGGRQYLLKESPDSLPRARRQLVLPVDIPVYNITNADHRKKPLGEVVRVSKALGQEYPLNMGLWYPDPCVTTNKLYHKFNVIMFHWLPAYFIDFLLMIFGQKRFMVRVQQKISTGLDVLQFFTLNAWCFKSPAYGKLWADLTPEDKKIFNMDMDPPNTEEEYFINCVKGGRQFILKEKNEDIPKARMHLKIMWAVDRICKTIIVGGFFYYLLKWTGVLAMF